MTFETVFDASRQSSVRDWLLPVGMVVAAFLLLASRRARSRLPYRLGYVMPILALIAAMIMAIAPLAQRRIIARDLTSRHYEILAGPVTELVRPTITARGFITGHFTVRGRRFSIPNYIVTVGFDNQGDAAELGHVVRITHDGDMILRVEVQR